MLAEQKKYFDRHLKLEGFGEKSQEKLLNSSVLVVGAGGLGCPVLQYLVTAGVGQIGIIDGDTIAQSNLHRQILFRIDDIGKSKAQVAASRLRQLQPAVNIQIYDQALTSENALEIFDSYDLIVDGTDNFAARYLVNDASVMLNKPFVSGAIDGYIGQISVFNYNGGPTYRCLYPDEPSPETCNSCSVNGVLNVLPGIVALYMTNEIIKVITGYGEVLSGKLLLMDIRTSNHQVISFTLNAENKKVNTLKRDVLLNIGELSSFMALHPETQLIDVREAWEFEESNVGGINIPLNELPFRKNEIDKSKPIILACQSGKRSRYAAKILKMLNEAPVYLTRLEP
ncbi:HesA/MoeB/ThiF family protein [Olivibacter sp. SDN3]|uniref:HesA/MoeB/ThiF family protein n=1 Tax=Olivibacter sp. SDN3 TaxID=2764720 RepID=UPI00165103B0|nr:HesA/MoeB/ThiF family protein [Olivibacter sp. SDN3]QNL51192.1 HesA/MoeB/ThiF family protein [Olivibacter sp. SDN3]